MPPSKNKPAPNPRGGRPGERRPVGPSGFGFSIWYVLGLLLLLALAQAYFLSPSGRALPYSEFKELLRNGRVQDVTVKGNGAYGIQQAARAYFKKSAKELDLPEAALLAGIPADPGRYDPATSPRNAQARRRHVLAMMLEQGKITRADFARAKAAPLPNPDDIHLPGSRGPARYFLNYVQDALVQKYGAGRVFGGGLEVTTTIDLRLQEQARRAAESSTSSGHESTIPCRLISVLQSIVAPGNARSTSALISSAEGLKAPRL